MISVIAMISSEVPMASITIRNLDDDLKARLRVVAASHGRSMEEEVRVILSEALAKQNKPSGMGTRIHELFAPMGGVDLELPPRNTKARAADFDE
jgi:plasmid stability protein